ncbi:hypothetical protein, conserved [Eimeria tenella]|uniref:Uncharacterized protein n=1 Tax=Eimeria tenella TaxID=5802 RepID=U6L1J1_EIMTE|nr:hypothetical protein, conserved [Eimeria tenella]CDJ44282.1 hypothetical protein, conserved [Eimeria tenella]|eukprot:XP_013235031.1 hypothetical protein, conserved [Eimeria tenella]
MKEAKGVLLEGRKSLYMSLQQNTGVSWFRGLRVLKFLEIHQAANPPLSQQQQQQVAAAVALAKLGP